MSAKLEKGKKKLNFCAQNQYLDIWHENSNMGIELQLNSFLLDKNGDTLEKIAQEMSDLSS